VQSIIPNNPNLSDAKMLKVILDDVGGIIESYHPGYKERLNRNYKKFKERCNIIEFCIDITHVAPPSIDSNYSNPRHHNENGNLLIAKEIFDNLKLKNFI
jgi:hypothetical protein